MYTGKMQQSLLQSKLNLKKVLQRNNQEFVNIINKYVGRRADVNVLGLLRSCLVSLPERWKNESANMLRVWTRQCECVFAQRIRRSQQMFSLYSRLWEEQALKQFLTNIRLQATRHGKEIVFSAVGVTAYNWDQNRIPDSELLSHMPEMEYIKVLKEKTVMCQICNKSPEKVDKNIIIFCDCEGRKNSMQTYENWTLFIEQPELIVWRRQHKSGSFEYKVYGTYNDVSAEDFLSVQIDTNYRKEWDPTAVALEIIDTDTKPQSNSDIIYWEMQWPRLFANRDYVFNRKFLVDKAKKAVILLNKGTEHPAYPSRPNKYRVGDYWSSMVIKPYTEIDKPGIEFSLTYYDNPGANIPQAVTSWVAYRVMPDFLTKLRAATLEYRKYCAKHNCRGIYSYTPLEPKKVENEKEVTSCELTESADDIFSAIRESLKTIVVIKRPESLTSLPELKNTRESEMCPLTPAEVLLSPTPIVQADQSYWKYLHPTYYIS